MGKVFGRCSNCSTVIVGGEREGELRFCSSICQRHYHHPRFCDACIEQTTDESAGTTFIVNVLFGKRLTGSGSRCPTCHSVIMRKWFWVLIPLFPASPKFRVLYQSPLKCLSRKLRLPSDTPVSS